MKSKFTKLFGRPSGLFVTSPQLFLSSKPVGFSLRSLTQLSLSFLLLLSLTTSIAQVTDDFSDGNFTTNTIWLGDTALFDVVGEKLQNNGSGAETSSIVTSNTTSHGSWEFDIEMDFNPSSTSLVRVYLMSDTNDLKSSTIDGYYVLIGNTTDEIGLYRQEENSETMLLQELDAVDQSSVKVTVLVQRFPDNTWKLFYKKTTGPVFQLIGSVVDATINRSSYFGFFSKYTPSRIQDIRFDNIQVDQDTLGPKLSKIEVLDKNTIQITFDETLDSSIAFTISNYSLSNSLVIDTLTLISNGVELSLITGLTSGTTYSLKIQNIEDPFGNIISDTTVSFNYVIDAFHDVLITEIMFSPSTVTLLPNVEYVEIYNSTSFPIDLEDWQLQIDDHTCVLPSTTLAVGEYALIIDNRNIGQLSFYGTEIEVNSLSLTTSESLTLYNDQSKRIHHISYTKDYYNDEARDAGGFSIEMIDLENQCGASSNWIASQNNIGGTPASQNSVFSSNPDQSVPTIENIFPIAEDTIQLWFGEEIDSASLTTIANYSLVGSSVKINQLIPIAPSYQSVLTVLSSPMDSTTIYELSVTTNDCQLNQLQDTLKVGLPHQLTSQSSIALNEILFDPNAGGSDFVEFINLDSVVYDLQNLRLANSDESGNYSSNPKIPSSQGRLIFPNEYYVLTEDTAFISQEYQVSQVKNLIQISDLPSLPDDEGGIIFMTDSLLTLDYFYYRDDYHLSSLSSSEKEGVSLERISLSAATNNTNNWTSSSSTSGFATPTSVNSQNTSEKNQEQTDHNFEPNTEVFSPDGDGIKDFVTFNYSFNQTSFIVNAIIYDPLGREVKKIANNEVVSTNGFFTWDGTSSSGEIAKIGPYILYVEAMNDRGSEKVYKEVIVLGGEL